MTIKHVYQPTENTCGQTCIYMLMCYILNIENDLPFDIEIKYNIKDISDMCGTDWIVGTPPDRMEKGMKTLDVKYTEYQNSPRPYELLIKVIMSGNIPMLRTITKGVPHWILVENFKLAEDKSIKFQIVDPWLGKIEYEEKQLDEIWKPRDYQFFEVKVPKEDPSTINWW